jgi:hypothetical protein
MTSFVPEYYTKIKGKWPSRSVYVIESTDKLVLRTLPRLYHCAKSMALHEIKLCFLGVSSSSELGLKASPFFSETSET